MNTTSGADNKTCCYINIKYKTCLIVKFSQGISSVSGKKEIHLMYNCSYAINEVKLLLLFFCRHYDIISLGKSDESICLF